MNWSRRLVGEPKPTWRANRSIGCDVISSRYCALRIRALRSHRSGVAPVCSRKRRLSKRVLGFARMAISSRVRSRWTFSSSHRRSGSRLEPSAPGCSCTMNWAYPPSRSRVITAGLEASAATAEP